MTHPPNRRCPYCRGHQYGFFLHSLAYYANNYTFHTIWRIIAETTPLIYRNGDRANSHNRVKRYFVLFDVSGNNPDEAAEIFSSNYNTPPVLVAPSEKRFWWRQTAIGDATMSLRKSWGLGRFETTAVEPGPDFIVASADSGHMIFTRSGVSEATPLVGPYVFFNDSPVNKITGVDVVHSVVHIDQNFVRGVAEELEDADFLDFLALAPAEGRECRTWYATVNLVEKVLHNTATATPLLRQEMSRLIAATMLSSFPYQSTERAYRRIGVEPSRVRAAIDFMYANAHLPIVPMDVAESSGLSVRSLTQAIRRYREITPTTLLQRIRLEHVHTDLQAANPATDSVSTIARRWGFIHPGRFSAIYRARFGQLPSKTLRS